MKIYGAGWLRWEVEGGRRADGGVMCRGETCATAHSGLCQIAQEPVRPPYSIHVLPRRGKEKKEKREKGTQSMASDMETLSLTHSLARGNVHESKGKFSSESN
jgi:hypothetical protein